MLSRLIDKIGVLHHRGRMYGIASRVLPSGVLIKYPVRMTYFGYVVSYSNESMITDHKDRLRYWGYLFLSKINHVKWRLEMLNGIF